MYRSRPVVEKDLTSVIYQKLQSIKTPLLYFVLFCSWEKVLPSAQCAACQQIRWDFLAKCHSSQKETVFVRFSPEWLDKDDSYCGAETFTGDWKRFSHGLFHLNLKNKTREEIYLNTNSHYKMLLKIDSLSLICASTNGLNWNSFVSRRKRPVAV